MDKQRQSELRRGENEVIFREYNDAIQRQIKNILPQADKSSFPVAFLCECSDEACREHVEVPVAVYERIHKRSKQFITKPGHNQPDIERIVEQNDIYGVNEKYEEPRPAKGALNRTDSKAKTLGGEAAV